MKGNKRNLKNFIFAGLALSMIIGSAGCAEKSKDISAGICQKIMSILRINASRSDVFPQKFLIKVF